MTYFFILLAQVENMPDVYACKIPTCWKNTTNLHYYGAETHWQKQKLGASVCLQSVHAAIALIPGHS